MESEGGGGRPVFTCVVVDAETSQEKFTHYFHIYFVCIFIEGNERGRGEDGVGGECMEKILNKICCACVNNFKYSNTLGVLSNKHGMERGLKIEGLS